MPTGQRSSKPSKRPRTGKNKHATEDSYGTPTHHDWAAMEDVEEIIVSGESGSYIFRVGDSVTIQPEGIPLNPGGLSPALEKIWMGVIVHIRRRKSDSDDDDDDDDIWVKIQWYYRPNEVAEVIKSFDATMCGKLERILSDHYDYVHCTTLDGMLYIKALCINEKTLQEQQDIRRDDIYCRYRIVREGRGHKTKVVKPKPSKECFLCDKPFAPPDSSSAQTHEGGVGAISDLTEMRARDSIAKEVVHCVQHSDCQANKRRQLEESEDHSLAFEMIETFRSLSALGAFFDDNSSRILVDHAQRQDYSLMFDILTSIEGDSGSLNAFSEHSDDGHTNHNTKIKHPLPKPPPPLPPSISTQIPRTLVTLAVQPLVRGVRHGSPTPHSYSPFTLEMLHHAIFDWTYRKPSSIGRHRNQGILDIAGNVGVVYRAREEVRDILNRAQETAANNDDDGVLIDKSWIDRVLGDAAAVNIHGKGHGSSSTPSVSSGSDIEADLSLIAPYVVRLPPRGLFSLLAGTTLPRAMENLGPYEAWEQLLDGESLPGRLGVEAQEFSNGVPWMACTSCDGLI
ncbi:hypothetical protein AAF712_001770 [Marasmius tenuissimus]|uniref:BAH domain-containing protein n=1 Tax=Marasmius tenuissimus TaxID=585030 RepID=A0ABR3ACS6_9AGAR